MPRTYWKDLYKVMSSRATAAEAKVAQLEKDVETLKSGIKYQSEEAQKIIEREEAMKRVQRDLTYALSARDCANNLFWNEQEMNIKLVNAMKRLRHDLKRAKTALSIIAGKQTEKDMAKMILDEMSAEERNRKGKK